MKAHQAPKAKEVLKSFYCWYDYSQFMELIVMKLRYDAENYRENSWSVDADIRAEEMIKCANFLEESSNDMNYYDEIPDDHSISKLDEVYKLQQRDLKVALNIIKDNVFGWWD